MQHAAAIRRHDEAGHPPRKGHAMATATTNKKKVLVTQTFAADGMALLQARSDIEVLTFPNGVGKADFNALLWEHAPVHAVSLGPPRFRSKTRPFGKACVIMCRSSWPPDH